MKPSSDHSLLIIGGGNMGMALATRWRDHAPIVVEPSSLRRAALKDEGFAAFESIQEITQTPDIVVLAVKPQSWGEISAAVGKLAASALTVSIMAGISLGALPARSARVMPNTPALIGQGMSVCCGPLLDEKERMLVGDLFAKGGEVTWVEDEPLLHAVTAVSGSGPAYLFAFMEAFEKAAIAAGLDASTAHLLVKQTIFGAASMANVPFADAGKLREQVTSKGGTTEAALAVLLPALPELLQGAVDAALARSKSLAS